MRNAIIVTVAVVAVAVVGYLVWDHVRGLEDQITALGERLDETQRDLVDSEERMAAAEERAEEADRLAAEATLRAEVAEEQAAEASARAQEADAGRTQAEAARTEAERESARAAELEAEAQRRAELAKAEAENARYEAQQAQRELENLKAQREQELNRLFQALNTIVETRRTALGMVMTLGSDRIEFEFDHADLKPEDKELISRIVGILLTSDGYELQIFGHADEVGTEEYNQRLSERRAQSVADYMIEAGISSDIMTVRGFGESMPLVEGDSPEAHARNRRVEIGIIDTSIEYKRPKQN
jgi:outer membrane protein OmpA-like peptidoglycan-associated protein